MRLFGSPLDGMTLRRTLLFGFGAVFALWLVSAYDLVRRLREVETRAAAISASFADGEELLFTVRAQVLLASVYIRDAALEIDPGAVRFDREQLHNARQEVTKTLQEYVPEVDSEIEREHWARLQVELDEYWNATMPALTQGSPSLAEGQAFLRQNVLPKREAIIRISDRIRTLNREAFQQQQAGVARLHGALRQRVWWTSGALVMLGLMIALVSARYARHLEARIRRQHLQELEHKLDLQQLSAKLVDAQEQERRSLARDLHDEVGQALTAIKMELAAAERHLAAAGSEANHRLHEARSIADRTLQTVRDLSRLLHPGMLDDFGLSETLRWYLRGFSRRTGLRAKLVTDDMAVRMPADLELCAYRIVQEALTNVAKHAEATSCSVYLQRLPHSLILAVEDDGKGMAMTAGRSGLGLISIRERVAGFGGTFRIEPGSGRGTRLIVECPVSSVVRDRARSRSDRETATSEKEQATRNGQTAHPTR